jgi:putative effector of murein hydrolase
MLAVVSIVAVAALLSCTHALGTVVKTANGEVEGAESALGLSWKGVCVCVSVCLCLLMLA